MRAEVRPLDDRPGEALEENLAPAGLREQLRSDAISLLFSLTFTAAFLIGYVLFARRVRKCGAQESCVTKLATSSGRSISSTTGDKNSNEWKILYGLISLTGFFGAWSTSVVILDAYNVALGLQRGAAFSGFLVSAENLGAIPGIFCTYLFLRSERAQTVSIRTIFVYSTGIRIFSWVLLSIGLSRIPARIIPGATTTETGPDRMEGAGFETSSVLLLARFVGGWSRGINTQISAPLVKYVVPGEHVAYFGPLLGLLAIIGSMSAAVFSASEMALVHFNFDFDQGTREEDRGAGSSTEVDAFAHEGTGIMGVVAWSGLALLYLRYMTRQSLAEILQAGRVTEEEKSTTRAVAASVVHRTSSTAGKINQVAATFDNDPGPGAVKAQPALEKPLLEQKKAASSRKAEEVTEDVDGKSRRFNIFAGALSIAFLRTLMLTGVEDSLALTLQTRFGWPNDHIGFVSFIPIGGGVSAFLLTPYLKQSGVFGPAGRRTPVIRAFLSVGLLGILVLLGVGTWCSRFLGSIEDGPNGGTVTQTSSGGWVILLLCGNTLLYLSVFGAERETLGILFQRMKTSDANWVALALSVCQLSGGFCGPPVARKTVAGANGMQKYCLLQAVLLLAMQIAYERCLQWVDHDDAKQ
ncbi:unnamed protein product [Amoebophrya sp. A120]|nr:unnamed protein product [Amoebophrya sp. A120]|eukprot:GSA120T00002397001.1